MHKVFVDGHILIVVIAWYFLCYILPEELSSFLHHNNIRVAPYWETEIAYLIINIAKHFSQSMLIKMSNKYALESFI